jgi:hypothetical protein
MIWLEYFSHGDMWMNTISNLGLVRPTHLSSKRTASNQLLRNQLEV